MKVLTKPPLVVPESFGALSVGMPPGTWREEGAFSPGVLDGWSNVTGAWSLSRKLVTAYPDEDPLYAASAGNLTTLYDQSETGVGSLKDFTPSGGNVPVGTGGTNARACIDYNRSATVFIQTDLDVGLGTFFSVTTMYLCAVCILDTVNAVSGTVYSNELLFGDDGQDLGIYIRSLGPTAQCYNYDGSIEVNDHGLLLGRICVIEMWHTGGNLVSRVNGGAEVSVASGDSQPFQRLKALYLANGIDGKLFELIVASAVPSQAQRDAYLSGVITHIGEAALGTHIADLGKVNDTGTDGTVTLTYFGCGFPLAGRKLLCGISVMDNASLFDMTGVTINGNAATVVEVDSNQTLAALASRDDSTAETASVIGTLSEGATNDQMGALVAAYGLASGAPAASGSNTVASGTSITLTLANAGFTAGHVVFVVCAKRASATAFVGVTDDGNSVNSWIEIENIAPPDGGARLGMWYKVFETSEVGTDVIITVNGGATSTELAAVYQRYAPA